MCFVLLTTALRILINVTKQTRRVDISHNLLGPDGLSVFLRGLTTLRSRYSTPDTIWGLRELNLATNGLDDDALEAVLAYAKKDVCLERLMVQGNEIKVGCLCCRAKWAEHHLAASDFPPDPALDPTPLIPRPPSIPDRLHPPTLFPLPPPPENSA